MQRGEEQTDGARRKWFRSPTALSMMATTAYRIQEGTEVITKGMKTALKHMER